MPTLSWIGKEKVINHHRDVPFKVLEHIYGFSAEGGKSKNPVNSGNKIIHGDNLEALKSLLLEYEGKINQSLLPQAVPYLVSAAKGQGCPELLLAILSHLPDGDP